MDKKSINRDLVEQAAKAGGREVGREDQCDPIGRKYSDSLGLWCAGPWAGWFNPLTDDGDALRLAATLKIDIEWQSTQLGALPLVEAYRSNLDCGCFCACENEANYRMAIVVAAAEIGRGMP